MDGEATTFGTTGYTYNQTFVLYDRKTDSVWFPYRHGEMNAVSGSCAGKSLPFLAEPDLVTLAAWRSQHPDSLVLIGSEASP